MWSRETFSERRFVGPVAWAGILALTVWATVVFALWSSADRRFPDLITVLVTRPVVAILFALGCAGIVAWGGRIRLRAALAGLMPVTLLLLVGVGVFSTALPMVGIVADDGAMLALSRLMIAWLTLGLLPSPLAPITTLIASAIAAVVVGFAVRMLSGSVQRGLFAFAVTSIGASVFWSVPSLIALLALPTGISIWSATTVTLERSLVALQQNGYWWQQMYARFPWVSQGEAKGSVELFFAAVVVLAFSLVTWAVIYRSLGFGARRLMSWLGEEQSLRVGVLFFAGFILALRQGSTFAFQSVDVLALVLALLALAFAWLFAVGRNDLADLRDEELKQTNRPLVTGELDPTVLKILLRLALVGAIVNAFVLGWPVFVALMCFVLWCELSSSPFSRLKMDRWLGPIVAGTAGCCVVLAGWFFGALRANASGISLWRVILILGVLAALDPLAKKLGRPTWLFACLYVFLALVAFLV